MGEGGCSGSGGGSHEGFWEHLQNRLVCHVVGGGVDVVYQGCRRNDGEEMAQVQQRRLNEEVNCSLHSRGSEVLRLPLKKDVWDPWLSEMAYHVTGWS